MIHITFKDRFLNRLSFLFITCFIVLISNFVSFGQDDTIKPLISTFRGNQKRNFYGTDAPSKLNLIWKLYLGAGQSYVRTKPFWWAGAGWTGQPLLILENNKPYLIQGAFDYHLRKIDANKGKEIWKYKFDDILKGTGTFWINKNASDSEEKYLILQGSRYGVNNNWHQKIIPSFRAISYTSGKELWRMNVKETFSYSRDCDGSALMVNDTAYIGLENGIFTVFNPDKKSAEIRDSILQPKLYQELKLYQDSDFLVHDDNYVTESSPALVKDKICITSCSRIFLYNLKSKQFDWDFFVSADIDGSPVVTHDNHVIVSIEKQYIKGKAGVMKLDISKPVNEAIVWYFPVEDAKVGEWDGGVIGTVAVNDNNKNNDSIPHIAAFSALDGFLYVIECDSIEPNRKVLGYDAINKYNTPKLLCKYQIGAGISSPIIVDNKIIAASYQGLYLFEFKIIKGKFELKLLDIRQGSFEASPISYNHRIFIASRDGYLYCFGDK